MWEDKQRRQPEREELCFSIHICIQNIQFLHQCWGRRPNKILVLNWSWLLWKSSSNIAFELQICITFDNCILHEQSEQSKYSEVKGMEKDIKNFAHAYWCEGMCQSVYLSILLSARLSVLNIKLKNFCWNEHILMKFWDQSNSVQVIWGRGLSLASRIQPQA